MRSVAALAVLFTGISASRQNNVVRVENGKVVGYDFATDLRATGLRSAGSGDDNVFTGQIGITDALNPNSPLSTWMDDLLNPDSDPYKQAVVDALKILLTILLMALGNLGIDTFNILILGFSQGSVIAEYQIEIPEQGAPVPVTPELVQEEVFNTIAQSDGSIAGVTIDNTETAVQTQTTVVEAFEGCADCWVAIDQHGTCIPDPDKVSLECRPDGMKVAVDSCVMGLTDLPSLTLNSGDCNDDNGDNHITLNADDDQYEVFIGLDECGTTMEFVTNSDTQQSQIEFSNSLQGNFSAGATGPDAIINTYDRYSINYKCEYATQYDDITAATDVTSSVNSGPITDGQGFFDFQLIFFSDDTFITPDASAVKVGTTLHFGVMLNGNVPGIEFTVTDCTVKNSDMTLGYDILTNRCENPRVHFKIFDNKDDTLTTFSYTVFEFKNDNDTTLHLSCNIIVCDSADAASTCATDANCSGRRRRRSIEPDTKYYRVAKTMVSV